MAARSASTGQLSMQAHPLPPVLTLAIGVALVVLHLSVASWRRRRASRVATVLDVPVLDPDAGSRFFYIAIVPLALSVLALLWFGGSMATDDLDHGLWILCGGSVLLAASYLELGSWFARRPLGRLVIDDKSLCVTREKEARSIDWDGSHDLECVTVGSGIDGRFYVVMTLRQHSTTISLWSDAFFGAPPMTRGGFAVRPEGYFVEAMGSEVYRRLCASYQR